MQLTAAIINAGLGDLSIGLEMAGFDVIAAYESEEKALSIHSTNMKVPLCPHSLNEIEVESFPKVDLLAAHIYQQSFSRVGRAHFEEQEPPLHKIIRIMGQNMPRAVFLLLNTALTKSEYFRDFLGNADSLGYKIAWKRVDVSQITGFPVKEYMVCLVGILKDSGDSFQFPEPSSQGAIPWDVFFQYDISVDPWYYRINNARIASNGDWPLLCWNGQVYTEAEAIRWNYMNLPLINTANGIRKITLHEVSLLKGFPNGYYLPEKDRQWLYKKLVYSGNVVVIRQVAGMISYTLSNNPWRNQQREQGLLFVKLFGEYLSKLVSTSSSVEYQLEQEPLGATSQMDFALRQGENRLYFEIKYYTSNFSLSSKLKATSEQIAKLGLSGRPFLVVANNVPEQIVQYCFSQYGVEVWDVKRLLWLFNEFSDIKNNFIALLNYSIDGIDPVPPDTIILQKGSTEVPTELDLKERLLQVAPGKESFQIYETVCVDILKYVLGEYLTLWDVQESTNDGLYRFDLCCKIKNDVSQDFFDTIKHYFNTKYIVFEFKNYSKKITQKEIYTTEKYLYEKALRKVAIIISRSGADDHALQAARGCLRETGKLILCLSDNSLLEMIAIKEKAEQEPAEFLEVLLDDLLVHLEK